jgi:hypothetical protein
MVTVKTKTLTMIKMIVIAKIDKKEDYVGKFHLNSNYCL